MAWKCAACGAKISFFGEWKRCRRCGAWLCKNCAYMANHSKRCPACGKHNPWPPIEYY